MNIDQWAYRWGIPPEAVAELKINLGMTYQPTIGELKTEAEAQNYVRIAASQQGARLWRNNVGVLKDQRGVPIRYGLANETAALNKVLKSSDLIGISADGRFMAREVKKPGWKFTGTAREKAQLNFLNLINSMGGDAKFTTGEL